MNLTADVALCDADVTASVRVVDLHWHLHLLSLSGACYSLANGQHLKLPCRQTYDISSCVSTLMHGG